MNYVKISTAAILIALACQKLNSQNLISNPGFEAGAIPTNSNQVAYATGWNNDCGTIVQSSYVLPGTPDLFDSRSTNCEYDIPNNKWGTRSARNLIVGNNYRYVGFTSHGNVWGLQHFGETVKGTLTQPLYSGCSYSLSFWAAAIQGFYMNCATYPDPQTPSSANKMEIVLRKDNDCSNGKIVYSGPSITSTNWVQFTGSFILTPAEQAIGYNRIEFRLNNNWSAASNPGSHCVYMDDVSLTMIQGAPISSDFGLTATNPSGSSTNYIVTANVASIPLNSGFWWEVSEIDNVGNVIPGTTMTNPANWWHPSLHYTNTFPDYYSTSPTAITGNGNFLLGHKYRVTRGTWGPCNDWNVTSKVVYACTGCRSTNGSIQFIIEDDNYSPSIPSQLTSLSENKRSFITEDNLNLFPNPNNGVFTVRLKTFEYDSHLIILDYTGKVIKTEKLVGLDKKIDLSDLSKGIYFIKTSSSNEIKKVIIQ